MTITWSQTEGLTIELSGHRQGEGDNFYRDFMGTFGLKTCNLQHGTCNVFEYVTGNPKPVIPSLQCPLVASGKTPNLVGAVLLVASDASSYVTVHTLAINGGALA